MNAVEMYYKTAQVALFLQLHPKTVVEKLLAGEFGDEVTDIGSETAHDYRVPASGINEYLRRRRVFVETGIPARTVGELRRKAMSSERG